MLSKIRAFSGAAGSPWGGGTSLTTRSSTSRMPMPILADTRGASMQGRPITSSTSLAAASGSALGRSILFKIGTTSRLWSMAR